MFSLCYFYIFFCSNKFHFFVSLYEELLESTFSPFLIVLHNLCNVFGCSVITDFISTVSKVFGFSEFTSDCFTDVLFFCLKNDSYCSLAIHGSGTFSSNF